MSARARITFYEKVSIGISAIALLAAAVPAVISFLQYTEKEQGIRIDSLDSRLVGFSKCCVLVKGGFKITNLKDVDNIIVENSIINGSNIHYVRLNSEEQYYTIPPRTSKILDFEAAIVIDKDYIKQYRSLILAYLKKEINFTLFDDLDPIIVEKENPHNFLKLLINFKEGDTSHSVNGVGIMDSPFCSTENSNEYMSDTSGLIPTLGARV